MHLTWADEAVAAGTGLPYSNTPAFAVGLILPECASFQTAANPRNPVDTTPEESFIKRACEYFLTQDLSDEPVQTEGAYVGLLKNHTTL